MHLKEYKNRKEESVLVARLTTEADLEEAYHKYLRENKAYAFKDGVLFRDNKTIAPGDYLIVRDGEVPFTEVDGMFRKTYYPADFEEWQKTIWLCAPTLVLMTYDTAEEAVGYLATLGDGELV